MTQATLRRVTLQTVANYSQAAERAVGAYRAGGHRLIAAMQAGVDRIASQGADVVVPRLAAAVRKASHRVGAFAVKRLDAVTTRTERAIEAGKAGVTAQVTRVATLAEGVDNRALATGLQTAVRLSLPGAQVALKVSERVAANADKMLDTIAAAKPAKAMRRAAKPAVAKKAKKAVATVKRAARKAVAQAAPAKAPRARRTTKAAAATETSNA
jgi:hypothetical protein